MDWEALTVDLFESIAEFCEEANHGVDVADANLDDALDAARKGDRSFVHGCIMTCNAHLNSINFGVFALESVLWELLQTEYPGAKAYKKMLEMLSTRPKTSVAPGSA